MRPGERHLARPRKPVEIVHDGRGVPHIRAQTEADLYRALGYAHAQDRLFQVELMRRLHAASWRNTAPSGSIPTACSAPCA